MKSRYTLYRRGPIYYTQDSVTRQQESLRTRDPNEARTLLHAKNEAHRQPMLNLQMARTYLSATDPSAARRQWKDVMAEWGRTKRGPTLRRHDRAMLDPAFAPLRERVVVETQAVELLRVIEAGTVSTNIFLRRLHNFALGINWLPWPILPKKRWPPIKFKEKRAVTLDEHRRIVAAEQNPERKAYYECCWHLGGAQTDIANLEATAIDWPAQTVSFARRKTGSVCVIRFGEQLAQVLRSLPAFGYLFPTHRVKIETHRAREFARACARVGVKGISLHSYRYAWAERARACGYPERFAQEALGHQSKAVHRAYARNASVLLPPLEEYEKRGAA